MGAFTIERNNVSERNHEEDSDWATAAEQSSEDDLHQDGDILADQERSVAPAEAAALHIEGEDDFTEEDLDEIVDPEADAIVNDALEIDSADEVEAAASVLNDSFDVDVLTDTVDVANDTTEFDAIVSADDADGEDPYAEFKADLRMLPGKWYVIHSYAGFERKVKANIEQRKVTMGVEDEIYQIEVPMEDVVEIKNGQRKMVTRVRIPGYVLVRMDFNEDTWSCVRHTPGVTGFVGNATNPVPLRFDEAFNMLKPLAEIKETTTAKAEGGKGAGGTAPRQVITDIEFETGETITIKEGSFAGLAGTISEIKPESGKLTVLVSLFERETPVELSFDQVTKL